MMNWGYGWGPGGWNWWWMGLAMLANWLLPLLLIALVVWALLPGLRRHGVAVRSEALEVLRQRYARGEITTEEFRRMKEELQK